MAATYSLCVFVWPSYAQLSGKVEDLIMHRLLPDDDDDHDGGVNGIEEMLEEGADGEAYLRRMYLSLHSQSMVSANDCALSGYFGCRQQCLYGCICFCLLLIGMYHGDRVNMPCIDWVNHVVLDGGCIRLGSEVLQGMGLFQIALLNNICKMASCKPIVNCIFDLVNMKNLSGGMIGPGNCQWFHNLMLFVTGGVSKSIQKVLKNHAAIHDACGFMLTHTDIGPGYGFGLFPNAMLHVSSAGAARSSVTHWLLSMSGFGQVSGLLTVYALMSRLRAPCLNDYNSQDIKENCIKDTYHSNFSKKKDGGSGCSTTV